MLPITLAAAGAAAIINFWIAMRAGRARGVAGVSIGDGGNAMLTARMRAHANFVEYTPFVLILLGLIEYNIGSPLWLWIVSVVFLLGRVAHPLGMDGLRYARQFGATVSMLTLLGLGIYATALPFLAESPGAQRITAPSRG
jgi:uncharacterized membrane protein YecN with MAPEG domain